MKEKEKKERQQQWQQIEVEKMRSALSGKFFKSNKQTREAKKEVLGVLGWGKARFLLMAKAWSF